MLSSRYIWSKLCIHAYLYKRAWRVCVFVSASGSLCVMVVYLPSPPLHVRGRHSNLVFRLFYAVAKYLRCRFSVSFVVVWCQGSVGGFDKCYFVDQGVSGLEHTSRPSTRRPFKSAVACILDLGSPNRPQHPQVALSKCEGWLLHQSADFLLLAIVPFFCFLRFFGCMVVLGSLWA